MPRPGGACSAYLFRGMNTAALFDIGTGSVAKLQLVTEYARLDAIVISHMHADHFFDLVPLRQGLKLRCRSRAQNVLQSSCLRAASAHSTCSQSGLARRVGRLFRAVFDVREYDPSADVGN